MSIVSIKIAENYEYDTIKNTIYDAVHMSNFKIREGVDHVLIKPNLCYYHDHSTGMITEPKFVEAIIDVFRESFGMRKISIIESDASAMKCKYVYKILGYEYLIEKKGVDLINLCKIEYEKKEVNVNNKNMKLYIPKIFGESSLLVNVPKIKYQTGPKMTCALKNIFGCNAYKNKYRYHKNLDESIAAINKQIHSDLVIIDGIIVRGVKPKKMGLVMASQDVVAIDSAAAKILGFKPDEIGQITLAQKEKIGSTEYFVEGEPLDNIVKSFPRKRLRHVIKEHGAKIYFKYLT